VGRHTDAPVLLEQRDPQAGRRQVPRGAGPGRPGPDYRDVVVESYCEASFT